jgi:hypothetical protein
VERLTKHHLAWLAIVIIITGAALAQAGDTNFQKANGEYVEGVRCGAPVRTLEETEEIALALDAWLSAGGRYGDKADVTIPVAVHVVAHNDGYGDISDQAINSQMQVLNQAYNGTGFGFSLASVDRTYNTKWSTHRYGSRFATKMKQALAIDPACKRRSNSAAGAGPIVRHPVC